MSERPYQYGKKSAVANVPRQPACPTCLRLCFKRPAGWTCPRHGVLPEQPNR